MVGIGIAATGKLAEAVQPPAETITEKLELVVNDVFTIAPLPVTGAEPDQV